MQKIEGVIEDDEVVEIFEGIKAWHAKRLHDLQKVIYLPDDHGIVLQTVDGTRVEMTADSDLWRGFIAGISTAAFMFEKLPYTIERPEVELDPPGSAG